MLPEPKVGKFTADELPNEEYHAHPAIGSSNVRMMNRSIAHFIDSKINPRQQTPAMMMGSLLHLMILDFTAYSQAIQNDYAVKPDGMSLATKDGKKWKAENEGKTILTEVQVETFTRMGSSIIEHPIASNLLDEGEAEISLILHDNNYGFMRKARFDYIRKNEAGETIIIDLKTTNDASPSAFSKSIANFGYHIQGAYYSDVWRLFHKTTEIPIFTIIAVENNPPYNVAVYNLAEEALGLGRSTYEITLRKYADYLFQAAQGKNWAGYPKQITDLDLPGWAYYQK